MLYIPKLAAKAESAEDRTRREVHTIIEVHTLINDDFATITELLENIFRQQASGSVPPPRPTQRP